jgi:signal transduction histidine kinase
MKIKSKEEKFEWIATIAIPVMIVLIFAVMVIIASQFKTERAPATNDVIEVETLTYQIEDGQLYRTKPPYVIEGVDPLSHFTVYASIFPTNGDSIRVETAYTSLRLYANDVLIYECGQPGTYPEFLIDPPTIINIVPLPDSSAPQDLRFEYTSPRESNSVSLSRVEYGPKASLTSDQFKKNGPSFVLSILFIIIGIVMTLSAWFYMRRFPTASIFTRLGIFTLAIGVWAFGECPFTALLIPYPADLYIMSYGGLLIFALPFLKFLELTLKPRYYMWFRIMRYVLSAFVIVVFVLQFTGQVSFAKNMYIYEIVLSAVLIAVLWLTVFEYVYYKRTEARHFVLPTFVIIFFALITFVNYEMRIIDSITIIFEAGALIFIVQLALICISYIRDASKALSAKANMEFKLEYMNQQVNMQKKQFETLTEATLHVREIRHDLRHQIAAMREYIKKGELAKLNAYLDELSGGISSTVTGIYCKNIAVNSVCGYYVSVAAIEGVDVDVRLDIPEQTGNVSSMDLCVIVGNLLENAIDALRRLDVGHKYIKARARVANETLSIIVENNFDGRWKKQQGTYISSKDDTERRLGLGLQSVNTVCEKYEGFMRIEHEDNIWRVSTIVNLV